MKNQFMGTTIIVTPQTDPLQMDVLIEATPAGQHLAELLGAGVFEITPDGILIHYTPALDERVKEIIDCLITLRYSHPGLMQLPLFDSVPSRPVL